jgi:poly-beta-1,6-N-acetyl-D-glucosamine synthase
MVCVGTIFYVYAGFPLTLWVLRLRRRYTPPPAQDDDMLPSITLLVAAYNEEEVIQAKLENCALLNYPEDKLQFLFVSDSTDSTNEILRRAESDRFRIVILANRRGKVAALAAAYPIATGDILVFSDANTYYRPDSLRNLVRHFQNPQVGLVTGDVRIAASNQTFGAGERLYYKYERLLQELETSFWSTVGIDGAMYALRKSLLRPASHGLIADDLVTGMNVGCQGYRLIYDPESVADEDPTPTDGQEFWRKVRVVAYAIQSLVDREGVPGVFQWRLLWVYLSHKVLRWFIPVFLMLAFIESLMLAFYTQSGILLVVAQLAFYGLALVGWRCPGRTSLLFRVPYYFTMVNAAALIGILRGLRRQQKGTWNRTGRLVSKRP